LAKGLIQNTLIISIGRAGSIVSGFLLIPLYTYYLSSAEYGMADLVINYAMLISPVVSLGLQLGLLRFLIDARENNERKTLILSISVKLLMCTFAVFIGITVIANVFIQIPFFVFALYYVCAFSLAEIMLIISRGLGENGIYSIVNVIVGIATLFFGSAFIIVFHMGADGVLLSLAISNSIAVIYGFFKLKLYNYIRFKFQDKKLRMKILKFSLPQIPTSFSSWFANLATRTLIAAFMGVSANGIFVLAAKFGTLFSMLFSPLQFAWMEDASIHANGHNTEERFSQIIKEFVNVFGTLLLLILLGTSIVFRYVIGKDFEASYPYIPIILIGTFLLLFNHMFGAIHISQYNSTDILKEYTLAAAINITFFIVSYRLLGLYAAPVAIALGWLGMLIWRFLNVKKRVSIRMYPRQLIIFFVFWVISNFVYYIEDLRLSIIALMAIVALSLLVNRNLLKQILCALKIRGKSQK
jgi:O-antigen/teichoic acid export membrane protein